jgi:hypothetical protein
MKTRSQVAERSKDEVIDEVIDEEDRVVKLMMKEVFEECLKGRLESWFMTVGTELRAELCAAQEAGDKQRAASLSKLADDVGFVEASIGEIDRTLKVNDGNLSDLASRVGEDETRCSNNHTWLSWDLVGVRDRTHAELRSLGDRIGRLETQVTLIMTADIRQKEVMDTLQRSIGSLERSCGERTFLGRGQDLEDFQGRVKAEVLKYLKVFLKALDGKFVGMEEFKDLRALFLATRDGLRAIGDIGNRDTVSKMT